MLSFIALAGEGDVAKVIILKGSVKAKLKSNKVITLKRGDWLPEGAQVKTEEKAFVKLLFIDKSQMNLGPNSQMIINKFPKKKAGIITLMKGQLRSKVTKDYMQMDKNKEKLYIKTKTAAMGVRGTDFEVSVKDGMTHTNLYEGQLVVTAIEAGMSPDQVRQAFTNPAGLTNLAAGQMAVFRGKQAPPAVLKIPANIMKEAVKSGGKKGDLKTLAGGDSVRTSGNNLLLPGTNKEDVANDSAGEESTVVGESGPVIKEEKVVTEDGTVVAIGPNGEVIPVEGTDGPIGEDGRDPASAEDGPDGPVADGGGELEGPPPTDCPLTGCGGLSGEPTGEFNAEGEFVAGPAPAGEGEPEVYLEDPCVLDPTICEVVPEEGDICALNPELPQCGGGATSTNVQFNFSTQ